MRLRASDESVGSVGGGEPAPREEHRGRVLVVDDEPLVAKALRRILADYEVSIATCGNDALQLVASSSFDAVVCDVMMPEMTGEDFYRRLVRNNASLARRTIFVTGGALTSELRAFLQSVDCPTLRKPLDSRSVKAVLRLLIASGSSGAG